LGRIFALFFAAFENAMLGRDGGFDSQRLHKLCQ
jgi:hypothetical protein